MYIIFVILNVATYNIRKHQVNIEKHNVNIIIFQHLLKSRLISYIRIKHLIHFN